MAVRSPFVESSLSQPSSIRIVRISAINIALTANCSPPGACSQLPTVSTRSAAPYNTLLQHRAAAARPLRRNAGVLCAGRRTSSCRRERRLVAPVHAGDCAPWIDYSVMVAAALSAMAGGEVVKPLSRKGVQRWLPQLAEMQPGTAAGQEAAQQIAGLVGELQKMKKERDGLQALCDQLQKDNNNLLKRIVELLGGPQLVQADETGKEA